MTQELKFCKLFYYWLGRFKLPINISIVYDNKLDCNCAISSYNKKILNLVYNADKINALPDFILINDLFHELGHIKNNLSYITKIQKVISERKAEQYSLIKMKKHYSKQYKKLCVYLKKTKKIMNLKEKEPIYYQAFKTIKEYRLNNRR